MSGVQVARYNPSRNDHGVQVEATHDLEGHTKVGSRVKARVEGNEIGYGNELMTGLLQSVLNAHANLVHVVDGLVADH